MKNRKKVDAVKPSFDKTNELKQIENIFPQNTVNKLIINELKKMIDLQNSIELDKL